MGYGRITLRYEAKGQFGQRARFPYTSMVFECRNAESIMRVVDIKLFWGGGRDTFIS